MPHTSTTTIRLYYETRGAGRPLLFISGTGGDLRVRPNILDSPLAASRHVIAYDQRGLGSSAVPAGPYSMAQYADDAAELLDELGHAKVDVIGVSFGGMVAQHLALRHADKVDKLVLCCTSPGGPHTSYPLHTLPETITREERMRRLLARNDTRCDEAWQAANANQARRIVEYALGTPTTAANDETAQRGARLQIDARAGHNVYERLPEIKTPTLICGGRFDGIAPPDNQAALATRIPNARLMMFEGGHLFMFEDATALPAILAFLDS